MFALTALALAAFVSAGEEEYVLVYLKTGAGGVPLTQAERKDVFDGHMANMQKLADAKKLVIAGPYGTQKHDAKLRGIFVFDVRTVDEAKKLSATDPGVIKEVFAVEACRLRTAAPLRKTLELEAADKAAAKKAGKEPKLGDGIRGYTMLTAKDAKKADAALAELRKQGKIVWSGTLLDDRAGQAVYILDAATPADAEKLLKDAKPKLGEHSLDSWWSTKNLTKLGDKPAN